MVLSSVSSEDPNIPNQLGETSSTMISGSVDLGINQSIDGMLSGSVPENSPIFQSLRLSTYAMSVLAVSEGSGLSDTESSRNGLIYSCSLPASSSEISKDIKEESMKAGITIDKQRLGLGTVSLNLIRYKGREPFAVKTPQGEPVAEIQPGSPLAFLHLNRQPGALRQMSPLERIQTMTKDLKEVFGLIDNPELFNNLKPEQQAVLTAAQSAVIVGISHLVPLFRRRTGLPFWKLDVLPQAVQQLHRLDSQAVSNQFGGHREVKVEDVEMMVITPQMRQQLAATYA